MKAKKKSNPRKIELPIATYHNNLRYHFDYEGCTFDSLRPLYETDKINVICYICID